MSEEKMTAEGWHQLAAKSLAAENKKIIDSMMTLMKKETDRHFKNQEKGLRDHFAGLAMQGYCTVDKANDWTMEEIAHDAYRQADEMLKEREEEI